MPEPIILDTNILIDVSRGNKAVADALNRYVRSGTPVYISRAAYEELVTRAKTPQLGGHYREMLNDMRIQIAPSGAMADRVAVYADNIQHTPARGQPGQIREYDRKNDPSKPGDVFVVAQTKALNGRLWTLDGDVIKRAPQFGVKLAPECSIKGLSGPEDPVKGRQLLGLNPKPIGINGQVLHTGIVGGTAGAYTVATTARSGNTGGGGKTGGGSGGAGVASVGVADNTLPSVEGPSPRGQAIAGGIQLAFEGANFVLNLINDHIQKQKVTGALDQIRPQISRVRLENPKLGILLLFYYHQVQAPQESIIKPGAVFQYVIWGKGATRDEAIEDAFSTPRISAGTRQNERRFSQEVWIPPLQKSTITTAKCPFPPIAIGRFSLGNSSKATFQLVEFNIVGGFDDIFEKSIELPPNTNAEFAILKPPSEVAWRNMNGRQTVGVPLKTAKTANSNDITVVDLDPYSPFNAAAAMCFPVDEWSETVFNTVRETDGCRVLAYVNFSMIRWIRAQNIHLLRFL